MDVYKGSFYLRGVDDVLPVSADHEEPAVAVVLENLRVQLGGAKVLPKKKKNGRTKKKKKRKDRGMVRGACEGIDIRRLPYRSLGH